jgi:hypothetical protein
MFHILKRRASNSYSKKNLNLFARIAGNDDEELPFWLLLFLSPEFALFCFTQCVRFTHSDKRCRRMLEFLTISKSMSSEKRVCRSRFNSGEQITINLDKMLTYFFSSHTLSTWLKATQEIFSISTEKEMPKYTVILTCLSHDHTYAYDKNSFVILHKKICVNEFSSSSILFFSVDADVDREVLSHFINASVHQTVIFVHSTKYSLALTSHHARHTTTAAA